MYALVNKSKIIIKNFQVVLFPFNSKWAKTWKKLSNLLKLHRQ